MTTADRDTWITDHLDNERIDAITAERLATIEGDREYVDPHPGKKGSDRIVLDCGKCDGTGYYYAPSRIAWRATHADGHEVDGRLCFACNGKGRYSVLVSSRRATARKRVREYNAQLASARENARTYAVSVERDRLDAEYDKAVAASAQDVLDSCGYVEDEKFEGVTATVARTFTVEGIYGTSLAVILHDTAGIELAWFTTASPAWDLDGGETVEIKGAVKALEVYEGRPQVKVSRCKFTVIDTAAA